MITSVFWMDCEIQTHSLNNRWRNLLKMQYEWSDEIVHFDDICKAKVHQIASQKRGCVRFTCCLSSHSCEIEWITGIKAHDLPRWFWRGRRKVLKYCLLWLFVKYWSIENTWMLVLPNIIGCSSGSNGDVTTSSVDSKFRSTNASNVLLECTLDNYEFILMKLVH